MLGRLICSTVVIALSILKECSADRIIHDAAETVINSKWLNTTEFYVHKFNRTQPALTFTWHIPNERELWNYTVRIDGYQRLGMEWIYKKSALSVAFPFCTFVTGAMANMKYFRHFGQMIEKCTGITKPRTYSIRDLVWDDRFPLPLLPGNYWRIDMRYTSDYDSDYLHLQYFFHIERSMKRRIFNFSVK